MYIQRVDLLDLIDACHVEVVSFDLKNKFDFYLNEILKNNILLGFFGSIATRTIGEVSK